MPFTRWKLFADRSRFKLRIWRTLGRGWPSGPRADRIIIDLSHCCDLSCPGCNRSCAGDQAPAAEFISLEQIRRFIEESVACGRRWRRILLEGGEPTLHPRLDDILAELQHYRQRHAPRCVIELCSNGFSARARQILGRLPAGIRAKNSTKSPGRENGHIGFNVAPADLPEFASADFGQGCYIQRIFGLGLTRHGFYPHPICGGIDRVLGLDIGLKALPASPQALAGQMKRLCPWCGHFREFRSGRQWRDILAYGRHDAYPARSQSPSWVNAYANFRRRPPRLSLY
jgi:hypothetical protein